MNARMRVIVATAVLLLVPATARAQWFLFPFAAANAGGETTQQSGAYGGSFGWNGRWLSAEAEVAWAPAFFDDDGGFRRRHKAATYTGTVLAGPELGAWRPYGALGFGVLRFEIEEVGGLASVSDDRPALHVGGGLMYLATTRLGVRGDVRYIRALDDKEPQANVFPERFADFDYWRIGAGVVIRW